MDEKFGGPLRVVVMSGEGKATEGHWWVKWVVKIEVISVASPWTLHLEGAIAEDIDSGTFESGAAPGCHGASWTDDDGHTWEGVPLWLLVGRVDDEISHEGAAFNDELADAGYEVQVIAADGYSQSFTSAEVKRNDGMIVAYKYDGDSVPEKNWPLKLVGPGLTNKQMVSQIVEIKVIFP
jgi:DMSO/TMAO reductase YedYZ molybdopterin-dependent catalytic subunit